MNAVIIDDGECPSFGLGVMFQSVLWQLEAWDHGGCKLPCFIACHSSNNLCRDKSLGANVWDYWFEQPFPQARGATFTGHFPRRLTVSAHHVWSTKDRARMREVATRYIRPKAELRQAVESVCSGFDPRKTLAVHLRGTDKATEAFRYGEAKRVPDDVVRRRVSETQASTGLPGLFGMTDDVQFADLLRSMGAIVRDIPHSTSLKHNPLVTAPGIQTGTDALIDALVAARCAAFLRTPSNLGCVTLAMGDPAESMIYPSETPGQR